MNYWFQRSLKREKSQLRSHKYSKLHLNNNFSTEIFIAAKRIDTLRGFFLWQKVFRDLWFVLLRCWNCDVMDQDYFIVVSLFCYLCRKRHWEAIFSCRLVVSHVFVLILILLTLPNAIFLAFKGLMWIISCFIGEIKWKMLKQLEGSFKNG